MGAVPALATLERRLAQARATAAGTPVELAALVDLASRLVPDPQRRGELAAEGAELAARLGDDAARLRCRAMVAEFVARHRSPTDALPDALQILAEAEQGTDPLARAQAHHTIAHCFDALDCTSEAMEHVQQGLDDYQRGGDRIGEGRMFGFLAALFWQLGETTRACELYELAYDIFTDCDELIGAAVMLSAIADLQRLAGDLDDAITTCGRSMELFERSGLPLDSFMGMISYAEALGAVGQHESAGEWARRAVEHNRLPDGTMANPSYQIDLLMVLARTAQLPTGDLGGARATLETAIALADRLGAVRSASEGETLLAEALHAAGDLDGAYLHMLRAKNLTEQVALDVHDQRVRALRVRFEVEQAQRDALRYREQAEAQAAIITELERTRSELAARMAELERLHAEVILLSQTDPLTGLANRRFVGERLAELCHVSARYGAPLAVAVFDVDRFKGINDRYGHGVGDDVLVALAAVLRDHLRASDVPARLGGDEFVVLLPQTHLEEAVTACQRLRVAVRDHPWGDVAPDLAVTITIGVAGGTGQGDPETLLRLADAALYRGKRAGRNTVTC
jgi:diguanylate cyclase (GGDEF)-like protein